MSAGILNEVAFRRHMPIPEALQIAWAEATDLTESGEPEKALELPVSYTHLTLPTKRIV